MINSEDNYITYSLIAIIAAVSLYALRDKRFFNRLIFHPVSIIHKKEYYRIVSSALVHNNILHLGLNLAMLYVFCSGIEESAPGSGQLTLLLTIGASLLSGGLLSLFVYRSDITYSSAGASGIAIGCMCSYFILHPFENHVSIPFIKNIPNVYAAAVYLILMLFYSKKSNGGKIDYSVHVGGGLGGSITAVMIYPEVIQSIL